MACAGCARRRRRIVVGAGRLIARATGRIPARALRDMVGVGCHRCGFEGDGPAFPIKADGRPSCPRCGSADLRPGAAR